MCICMLTISHRPSPGRSQEPRSRTMQTKSPRQSRHRLLLLPARLPQAHPFHISYIVSARLHRLIARISKSHRETRKRYPGITHGFTDLRYIHSALPCLYAVPLSSPALSLHRKSPLSVRLIVRLPSQRACVHARLHAQQRLSPRTYLTEPVPQPVP